MEGDRLTLTDTTPGHKVPGLQTAFAQKMIIDHPLVGLYLDRCRLVREGSGYHLPGYDDTVVTVGFNRFGWLDIISLAINKRTFSVRNDMTIQLTRENLCILPGVSNLSGQFNLLAESSPVAMTRMS